MAFYQIKENLKLPASVADIWDFVSSPENLKVITPEYMGFRITNSGADARIYPGMIITYKVSPLWGIQLDWMTEITHVKEQEYFVDEQRLGPYRLWHHQHKLTPVEGGTLMTDIVTYIPPLGWIGAVANSMIIKKQLKDIFHFRTVALEQKFGKAV